ncbi:MAG: hypothetical protein HQL32_08220 [Planctomycetes bacterium]|nr:hypothetical protein [Planctomycetota bacterium]
MNCWRISESYLPTPKNTTAIAPEGHSRRVRLIGEDLGLEVLGVWCWSNL